MPAERLHHPSGPLFAALALAGTAGFVDAHVYLHVTPVFVANMSGNLVHLGMSIGSAAWSRALSAGVAIVSFALGVALSIRHFDRSINPKDAPKLEGQSIPGVSPKPLLVAEFVLLTFLTVFLSASRTKYSEVQSGAGLFVLVVAAFSMGVQTAALRGVGQVAVATTYGTGAIVRIVEKGVLAFRQTENPNDQRRRSSIVVLSGVVTFYILGAAIAAGAGTSHLLLMAPSVTVGLVALRSSNPNRSDEVL
ncbi:MAG TPA: YoaK family protein [Microthrixaceae bacterium]|nr:YoaK family protein [Microthrixaceae bacterium]